MKKALLGSIAVATAGLFATGAAAQTMPMGEELYGQNVEVAFADGTTNTVTFNPNGTAVIRGNGFSPVNATWRVQGNQLCMSASGATECWDYNQRFVARTPVTLQSTCDTASRWTALSTAALPATQPAPTQQVQPVERAGERG